MIKFTVKMIFLMIFFLFFNTVFARIITPEQNTIKDALTDLYNFRFDRAENKLREYQSSYPSDIKGYYYETVINFYKAVISRDDGEYDKYLDKTDDVIEKCEDILSKDENNIEVLYYKGLAHTYRALLIINLNKSILKAASNGNDGYRILSEITKRKPDFYDAYMGLGMFKMAIGYVPEKFKWLLSIIGFKGSIKEGLEYLKTASEKGDYNKVEAKVYYALFSIKEREFDNSASKSLMKSLTEEYPESPAFKILYAGILQQNGYVNESISMCEQALLLNRNSMQKEIFKGLYGILANSYFLKNDFYRAIDYYEKHIQYVNTEDKYNNSLYNLGLCYELTGRREIALQKYNAVRSKFIEEYDGEVEKITYRYSRERITIPLNKLDSLLITGINLLESNSFNEALSVFDNILNLGLLDVYNTDDYKVKFYHDYGKIFYRLKNYTKAIEYLTLAVTFKPRKELWKIPHSYFELAKIYNVLGDNNKSKEMLEKIEEYNDFDFKMFLEMRIRNYIENK